MNYKKEHLQSIITSKIIEIDEIDLANIFYSQKDYLIGGFKYKEALFNGSTLLSNRNELSRVYNELYSNIFELKFTELIDIVKKYLEESFVDYILEEEKYINKEEITNFNEGFAPLTSTDYTYNIGNSASFRRYGLYNDFSEKENKVKNRFTIMTKYFKDLIKSNGIQLDKELNKILKVSKKDIAEEFEKDIQALLDKKFEEKRKHELSFYIKHLIQKGELVIERELCNDKEKAKISYVQNYKYEINNGLIHFPEREEYLYYNNSNNRYNLNNISEDLVFEDMDMLKKCKNRDDFREYTVHKKLFYYMLELLSKQLLNVKLNEMLPEKTLKIKRNKI